MENLKSDSEAFIIRIWQESESQNVKDAVWRGSIIHVGSNHRLYFCDLSSVIEFIKEQAGMGCRLRIYRIPIFFSWINEWIFKFRTSVISRIFRRRII